MEMELSTIESKHHTSERVIRKLAEGDEMLNKGAAVAEVARPFALTETTRYRWKNAYYPGTELVIYSVKSGT